MNISNLNLNLLRVLNALLNEAHVTMAGRKIGLSQSAMSISLKQLREFYQDALLVRGQGGQMRLTPLAQSLKVPVRQALLQIEYAFTLGGSFDPSVSDRTFHIGMSDYIEYVLLPTLIKKINELAPHIKIAIHHLNDFDDLKLLEKGHLDLVIGNFQNVPSSLMTQGLFTDEGTFVVRKNHPITKKKIFTFKDLLQYPMIMVSFVDDPTQNFLDHILKKHGYDSKVTVTVPHALMALYAIRETDFVTHTVKRIAIPLSKQFSLSLLKPPIDMQKSYLKLKYTAFQYWHKIVNNEPSHIWFRQIVKQVSMDFN